MCSNMRRRCTTREIRGQSATSSDGLRTAGGPGDFRAAGPRPEPVAERTTHFEVSSHAATASDPSSQPKPKARAVFFLFLSSEARAEQGSHVRHETEPQERAESRVSISLSVSLAPCTCERHSDQNHFTGAERGMRDGRSRKKEEWSPCDIWGLMHSTEMEHNLLIPLGTDRNHFKQPGRERGKMYGEE